MENPKYFKIKCEGKEFIKKNDNNDLNFPVEAQFFLIFKAIGSTVILLPK